MAPLAMKAARAVTENAAMTPVTGHLRATAIRRSIRRHVARTGAASTFMSAAAATRPAQSQQHISRESTTADPTWQLIVQWLHEQGGFVDDRLQLTAGDAPCGSRGVVATAPVSVQDLDQAPLIVVPQSAYMTTEDAQQLMDSMLAKNSGSSRFGAVLPVPWLSGRSPSQRFAQLPAAARLALLLAHERGAKGPSSRWWPYIAALPKQPPNAWLMSSGQLREALEPLAPDTQQQWLQATDKARQAMQQLAASCHRNFGSQLQLDDSDTILWALGQVLSRAFGASDCMGLAPVIDLLNHCEGAAKPRACTEEGLSSTVQGLQQGQGDASSPRAFWYVTSTRFSQPLPLAPGDELCISYVKGGSNRQAAALEAFLNFGFVPLELQG